MSGKSRAAGVLLGSFTMADKDIDAMGPLGTSWRDLVAANQPCRRMSLPVEVVPLDEACFAAAAHRFWQHLGDLVADVLIDGVDGPWGTTAETSRETLAA